MVSCDFWTRTFQPLEKQFKFTKSLRKYIYFGGNSLFYLTVLFSTWWAFYSMNCWYTYKFLFLSSYPACPKLPRTAVLKYVISKYVLEICHIFGHLVLVPCTLWDFKNVLHSCPKLCPKVRQQVQAPVRFN